MSEPTALQKLEGICAEIYSRWDKDQRPGKLLSALAGGLEKYRQDVTDVRAALADGGTEDRQIILALFAPQSDHKDGCLFKGNPNLPCQCGFSTVVGHYRWALRRAREIAAEHHGAAWDAKAPHEEHEPWPEQVPTAHTPRIRTS